MRKLEPRLVLKPACALVALLWSIAAIVDDPTDTNPWLLLLAPPALLLVGPAHRLLPDASRLLLALLAASLSLAAVVATPASLLLVTAVGLLTTTLAIEHSGRSTLAPDAFAAALAVATALWLGMQGLALAVAATGSDYANVALPLLLALVLAALAVSSGPQLSPGSPQWLTGWPLVVLTAIPAWTFIPQLFTTSAMSAAVVVPLLLACAVAAMALLPLIPAQRFTTLWLVGAVAAAIGIQVASTAILASAMGLMVTPFLLRYVALGTNTAIESPAGQTPTVPATGALAASAALLALGLLALAANGFWPTAVHPGAIIGVAVLFFGLTRVTHGTSYQQAQPSALHWPGVVAGLVAVALLGWYLVP